MNLFLILTATWALQSWAGRPVIHQLSENELIQSSELIVRGEFKTTSAKSPCAKADFDFYITHVEKGDAQLLKKLISVFPQNHLLISSIDSKNSKGPSYKALYFKDEINYKAHGSTVFLKKSEKNCYELVAQGAQVENKN